MTAEEFIAVDPCSSAPRLTPRRWAWLGFALWLPVVGGGMFWMAGYANRAGARGSAGPEVVAVEPAPQSRYRLRMSAVVLGDEENVGSSPVFGCELFADTPAGAR